MVAPSPWPSSRHVRAGAAIATEREICLMRLIRETAQADGAALIPHRLLMGVAAVGSKDASRVIMRRLIRRGWVAAEPNWRIDGGQRANAYRLTGSGGRALAALDAKLSERGRLR